MKTITIVATLTALHQWLIIQPVHAGDESMDDGREMAAVESGSWHYDWNSLSCKQNGAPRWNNAWYASLEDCCNKSWSFAPEYIESCVASGRTTAAAASEDTASPTSSPTSPPTHEPTATVSALSKRTMFPNLCQMFAHTMFSTRPNSRRKHPPAPLESN